MRALLCPLFVVTSLWLSTALSMESYKAEDGYEVFPGYNQSRYKVPTVQLDWDQAMSLCQGDGGGSLLAVINSDEEAEVVSQLMTRVFDAGFWAAFVGISDLTDEGTWLTVRGEPVEASGYAKWAPGHPYQSPDFNCGVADTEALYNAFNCSNLAPFICEMPAL